jgi:acyl carrier protein
MTSGPAAVMRPALAERKAVKELKLSIKELIIDALQLEEVTPDDIEDEAPLFGDDGLGLDSVDALELVMEVERVFGAVIEDNEESRKILFSVDSLAKYISAQKRD